MKKLILFPLFFILFSYALTFAQTVYITKTGSKYHTASCSYLRNSKIPIELKDAITEGYTPCSRCNPPVLKSKVKNGTQTVVPETNKTTIDSSKSTTQSTTEKTIYTGPRGGKYYINSHGKKTYIKRK